MKNVLFNISIVLFCFTQTATCQQPKNGNQDEQVPSGKPHAPGTKNTKVTPQSGTPIQAKTNGTTNNQTDTGKILNNQNHNAPHQAKIDSIKAYNYKKKMKQKPHHPAPNQAKVDSIKAYNMNRKTKKN